MSRLVVIFGIRLMHQYKGAAYGSSPTSDLSTPFPLATPIDGLFQTGQTAFPGYGVRSAAISGILTAETLLKTTKKNSF